MLDITTTLEQNSGSDRLSIPYVAHVECGQLVNRGPNFQVPVRASYTGMKKTYSVEVSGFRLTTEHVNNVPTLIERLLEGVTPARPDSALRLHRPRCPVSFTLSTPLMMRY